MPTVATPASSTLLESQNVTSFGVEEKLVEDVSLSTILLLTKHWCMERLFWTLALLKSGWQHFWEICGRIWERIDLKGLHVKLLTALDVLWRSLVNLAAYINQKTIATFEYIICYPCIEWLGFKVGIPPKYFVLAISFVLLVGFLWLLYDYKGRKGRHRRRDRSLSLDISGNAVALRERAISDLSSSQRSRTRGRSRSRGLSLDFWNKSSHLNRERLSSLGLLTAEELFNDLNNPIQHGVGNSASDNKLSPTATRSHFARNQPNVIYYGPTQAQLMYNTITPPPSWQEASRSLLPQDSRMKLQREILLDLSKDDCTLTIRQPQSRHYQVILPVSQCSVHVKSPVIGGVLEVYVKESPKQDWMEHTFDSAKSAAQFQIDLLAIQVFGPALHRMYQSLELIHQGSMACEGREYVCHHDQISDDVPQGVGVAWDDVMRALGSNIPSVRVALERLWWHHYSSTTLRLRARRNRAKAAKQRSSKSSVGNPDEGDVVSTDGGDGSNKNSNAEEGTNNNHSNDYIHLTMDYIRKRLLLGPIDFFRLFVPFMPDTALPRNDSSKKRMEQLLRWRKRTAKAALLVQSYVKARIIVNKGWILKRKLPTHYLTRRLAFDDNIDNSQRDASAKNEYYEATVSRDVLTFVRPHEPDAFKQIEHWWQWRPSRLRRSVISRYQAFTLVGHHIFRIPEDDDFPLCPKNDPVMIIPSLRDLIESNPDHEFFVTALFPEASKVGFVTAYIRTLPPGIDPAFDLNMARYKHGTKAVRDSKLSMMIQLGSSEAKPLTEVVTVSMMSFLMKTATEGSDGTPYSDFGPSDRNPFPVIPMASFCETRHFGGALQKERHLPKNYVSATAHIDSQQAPFNVLARLLLSSLERGALAKNVFDMTYILAANEQDELPERALCTIRAVHIHPNDVALPSIFIWGSHNRRRTTQMTRMRQGTTILSSMIGNIATLGERFRSANRDENDDEVDDIDHTSQTHPQYTQEDAKSRIRRNSICVMPSDDPIELAVNELVDILDGVHIPIRRDQLPFYEFTLSIPLSLLEIHNSNDGASHNKDLITMSLLLLLKRGDIKRHLIAADCNIKKAAVRIVESAAWYGQTFPIDTKMCRIELQSGQFFQQGRDLLGHPVFYFRNMGLGPWRGDLDASVAATLYRLDEALRRFTRRDECVQITLIVIVGKPFRPKDRKKLGATDGASTVGDEEELDDMLSTSFRAESSNMEDYTPGVGGLIANPRINPEESWLSHTNKRLVRQLVDLVSAHYPERLHQALIVVDDNQILSLKRLMGSLTLSSFVDSNRTRSKVKFLSKFSELEKYVSKGELVSIAGGLQPIDPSAFELTS